MLVASANPLDTYLVHNPEAIFGEPVEATTFDPANPYVLAPHLCAAAAEIPLTVADLELFGLADSSLPDELAPQATSGMVLESRPTGISQPADRPAWVGAVAWGVGGGT